MGPVSSPHERLIRISRPTPAESVIALITLAYLCVETSHSRDNHGLAEI